MLGANTRILPSQLHIADVRTALSAYERIGLRIDGHFNDVPIHMPTIKEALANGHPFHIVPEPRYHYNNFLRIGVRWCGDQYKQRIHFSPLLERFARDLQVYYEEKFDAQMRQVYLSSQEIF